MEPKLFTDGEVTSATGMHIDQIRMLITDGIVEPDQSGGGRGKVRLWSTTTAQRIGQIAALCDERFGLPMAHTLTASVGMSFNVIMFPIEHGNGQDLCLEIIDGRWVFMMPNVGDDDFIGRLTDRGRVLETPLSTFRVALTGGVFLPHGSIGPVRSGSLAARFVPDLPDDEARAARAAGDERVSRLVINLTAVERRTMSRLFEIEKQRGNDE